RVTVSSSPALNPTGAITIEAWVLVSSYSGFQSILGKGWHTSWGLFIGPSGTLRSYVRGCPRFPVCPGAFFDAGFIPLNEWTHVAVVFDGTHRFHYIDGELVGTLAETGALPGNSNAVELGSDPDFHNNSLHGYLDEVRLWNVARTQAQIRSTLQGFT